MDGVVADRYELRAPLGTGGNAEVFEAWDQHLQRRVALKRARTDAADPAAAERLTREARVAAQVTHPNVVPVLDGGVDADGRPFLVTELVEGSCLAEVLRERGRLPVDEAVRVVSEVLAGLEAVHAEGIVHRDIKPGNVLLAEDGTAKLADFGIARDPGDATGLTATGQVIGTAAYLSPEQAEGRAATPRSDLYAVGVLLYELLTGARPFAGSGAAQVALAHRDATVPSVVDARPDVPAEVVAVLDRALAKDPADRPADAAAMRAELTGAAADTAVLPSAGGEPTEVVATSPLPGADSPPEPSYVGEPAPERRSRRRPAAVLALVAGGLALAVGLLAGAATRDDGVTTESAQTAPPTTAPPSTAAGFAPPPTTAAPTTTVPAPSAREAELEARLDEVLNEEDEERQARDAERLIRDIEKWVDHGELDPTVAQQAVDVLTPLVGGGGHGDEHGHGHGDQGSD